MRRVKEVFEWDSRFWQGIWDTVRYEIGEGANSRESGESIKNIN